jgi:hypothetical protein
MAAVADPSCWQGLSGDPTYLLVREDSTLENFGESFGPSSLPHCLIDLSPSPGHLQPASGQPRLRCI